MRGLLLDVGSVKTRMRRELGGEGKGEGGEVSEEERRRERFDAFRDERKCRVRRQRRKRERTYGHLKVPQHLGVILGDDADVDVGSRSQIVEDSGRDGFGDHLDGFLSLQRTKAEKRSG